MGLQIINLFYNVDLGVPSDSDGAPVRQEEFPLVYRSQKDIVLAVDFIRTGGAAFTGFFLGTDTFLFAADVDFNSGTPVLMQTLNAGFNVPGDRPDLDIANGKISVRLDANTVELASRLGNESFELLEAEIQVFPAAVANPKGVFRLNVFARNLIDPGGLSPNPPLVNFYTKTEVDAFLSPRAELVFEVGGIDFKTLQTVDLRTVPVGKRQKVVKLEDVTDAISGAGTPHSYKGKTDDGPRDITAVKLSESDAVNKITRLEVTDQLLIPAGKRLQAEITVASTFTTHTGRLVATVQEWPA